MNKRKTVYNYLFIIFVIIFSQMCSSLPKKPKPQDGNWKICYACKSTGVIEVEVISPDYNNDESIRTKDHYLTRINERNEKIKKLENQSWFERLFEFDSISELEEENKYDREALNNEVPNNQRSFGNKLHVCGICQGVGWIKIED